MHFIDLQQIKHRLQHRQPATDDGFSVFLDTVQAQVVQLLRLEQALFEPSQAVACDASLGPAGLGQNFCHRAHRARGAIAFVPVLAVKEAMRLVEHGHGTDLGSLEGLGRPQAVGEILHRPSHAAHAVRLQGAGGFVLAQNHLG